MKVRDEDWIGIQQLMARYALSLDFARLDDYVGCFTPGGAFEILGLPVESPHSGAHRGADQLRSLAEMFSDGLRGHVRHWNHQPVIEMLDDEHARMTSYLMVLRAGEAPRSGVLLTGVYRDVLEKIDGEWLFKRRVFRADMQPEHPLPPTDVLVLRRDAFVDQISS